MANNLHQDHRELLQKVAANEGIADFRLEVTGGAVKGDNYMGIIKLITISDKNANKRLNLVLKCAQTNENYREMAPIELAFNREEYIYNKLLPRFVEFQKECNIPNPFDNYPKIYDSIVSNKNECIVLGNLVNEGYKMCDRKLPMNNDHISLVFTTYARFHAVSMALRKQQPEKFKEVSQPVKDSILKKMMMDVEGWLKSTNLIFENGIKTVEDNEKAIKGIVQFREIFKKFLYLDMADPKYRTVVLHADSWCNNMMFKYEDKENPEKPTELCILDWQLATLGSPIRDLTYFICSACAKEQLDQVDTYLDIYYDSLCKALRDMDCDPEELFPRSSMDEHWRKFAKFGLYTALALLKAALGDSEETPDLEKSAEEGKDLFSAFNSSTETDLYKRRLTDVVMFFVDRDLI